MQPTHLIQLLPREVKLMLRQYMFGSNWDIWPCTYKVDWEDGVERRTCTDWVCTRHRCELCHSTDLFWLGRLVPNNPLSPHAKECRMCTLLLQ